MLQANNALTNHKIITDSWRFLQHSRRPSTAIYVKVSSGSIVYKKIHLYKEIFLDKKAITIYICYEML